MFACPQTTHSESDVGPLEPSPELWVGNSGSETGLMPGAQLVLEPALELSALHLTLHTHRPERHAFCLDLSGHHIRVR